jgi:polyisoprenoid-binding protein YceI
MRYSSALNALGYPLQENHHMHLLKWLALFLLLPGMAIAQETYSIDPVHSRVAFRVMHAGFSPSLGTVSQPVGRIVWSEQDISKSSVSAQIPVNTLDLGNDEWNRKTLKTFLAVEKNPTASFQSSTIRVISESLLEVDGELQIAGGSIPITFITIINANKRHPLTFKKTLGMQASTDFSRKALGIDAWSSLVGDTVHLDIAIEATLDKQAERETSP